MRPRSREGTRRGRFDRETRQHAPCCSFTVFFAGFAPSRSRPLPAWRRARSIKAIRAQARTTNENLRGEALGRPVCRDRTDRRNRAAQGALGPPDVSGEDGRPVAGVGEDAERHPPSAVADEAVRLLEGGGDIVPPAGDLDLLGDFGFPRRSAAGRRRGVSWTGDIRPPSASWTCGRQASRAGWCSRYNFARSRQNGPVSGTPDESAGPLCKRTITASNCERRRSQVGPPFHPSAFILHP